MTEISTPEQNAKMVKVQWTIETTETFEAVIPWEEFAAMFQDDDGTDRPTPEDWYEGEVDKSDIDAEKLADGETDEACLYRSVDQRYVDSVSVIEAAPAI